MGRIKPLFYLPGVDKDLTDSATWYENQQHGLGKRFLAEFDLVCHRLPLYPELYPVIQPNIRRVLLRDFKYAVYYRIQPDSIEIIAVLSNRINPDTVDTRLPSH